MMPSSSQVLDHQLICHIMYGLRQFHHRQNKGEERGGEIWQKKSNSCLTNIERKRCKKSSCYFPNIEDRKGGKKTTAARSHMNIICLISSEPDRQIGQSEFSPIWRWNMTPLQNLLQLKRTKVRLFFRVSFLGSLFPPVHATIAPSVHTSLAIPHIGKQDVYTTVPPLSPHRSLPLHPNVSRARRRWQLPSSSSSALPRLPITSVSPSPSSLSPSLPMLRQA
jgi:hypothetical protein